jgi:cell division transport system permease protein
MKEPGSKFNPSIIYSTVSIAIVLFLLATYGLVFFHASNISNLVKEKINIIVELKEDSNRGSIDVLIKNLSIYEGVRSGSVNYIPKEEAYLTMKEFLNDVGGKVEDIPFKDVITFNMGAEHYSEENIGEIKNKLLQDDLVLDVFAENETIDMVKGNIEKASFISLIIGAIFVFLSLAIIYNTMKLKLHADRMEIKTMQLVGATRVFIAKPYIKEAIQLGLRAFIIVSTFVIALLASLYFNIDGFDRIINWWYALFVLVGILTVGIVLTVGVTRYVVQGYLNAERSSLV